MRTLIAATVLLMLAGAAFAAVSNVSLGPVSDSGISGATTTIIGSYGGVTPHNHAEVNVRMSQLPPSNSVYEAWLIDNDSNAKRSLGVLDGVHLNANMITPRFSGSGPWDAIAISTEPVNDSSPLPTTIVAQGMLPGSGVSSSDFTSAAVLPPDEALQMQLAMDRFNLTRDQVVAMRMDGLRYRDINLAGNIAMRCGNRSAMQVAREYVESGADLAAVAGTCNMTVAQLLNPAPVVVVAGTQQEYVPGTTMVVPNYYLRRPNGAFVVTRDQWERYRDAGYSWQEVAMAANISRMTGERVGDILRATKTQGLTFRQIAASRNIVWDDVDDVSMWPWERGGGEETIVIVTPRGTTSTTGPSNY